MGNSAIEGEESSKKEKGMPDIPEMPDVGERKSSNGKGEGKMPPKITESNGGDKENEERHNGDKENILK